MEIPSYDASIDHPGHSGKFIALAWIYEGATPPATVTWWVGWGGGQIDPTPILSQRIAQTGEGETAEGAGEVHAHRVFRGRGGGGANSSGVPV